MHGSCTSVSGCSSGEPELKEVAGLIHGALSKSTMVGISTPQKYKNAKVIIGWGSSMSKCATVIASKKRILAMVASREDKQLWQLGCKEDGATENIHPLFMGIRYSNSKWFLRKYDIPEELRISEDVKETSEPVGNVVVAKRTSKAKQAEKLRK